MSKPSPTAGPVDQAALGKLAMELSSAFMSLGTALQNFAEATGQADLTPQQSEPQERQSPEGVWSPAHAKLPWKERTLRQSLIIKEICEAGGSVPHGQWKEIAAKYGYEGRGLAGFFRNDKNGLLEMKGEGERATIKVTRHGRQRLAQNEGRISELLSA